MVPIITPAAAASRNDTEYIVDFYWRGNPVLERIVQAIGEHSCGELRSLRLTWGRPKNRASDEAAFLGHTLPAALDGARQLADSELAALHIEKVPGLNNLFALAQFANGIVAELELNECLPDTMPDTCFLKANFTHGHITNQPLVGHFNTEGAVFATDDSCQTMLFEFAESKPADSPIELMRHRFVLMAERGMIPTGDQRAKPIMTRIEQALGEKP